MKGILAGALALAVTCGSVAFAQQGGLQPALSVSPPDQTLYSYAGEWRRVREMASACRAGPQIVGDVTRMETFLVMLKARGSDAYERRYAMGPGATRNYGGYGGSYPGPGPGAYADPDGDGPPPPAPPRAGYGYYDYPAPVLISPSACKTLIDVLKPVVLAFNNPPRGVERPLLRAPPLPECAPDERCLPTFAR